MLVVEDSESSQITIKNILLPYADCDGALDGVSAVGKFRDALLSNDRYDVICMDITMPKMDGKAALRIIREIERQQGSTSTPVIMITASGDAMSKIETMHELRATSYLVKPISKESLIATIRKLQLLDG